MSHVEYLKNTYAFCISHQACVYQIVTDTIGAWKRHNCQYLSVPARATSSLLLTNNENREVPDRDHQSMQDWLISHPHASRDFTVTFQDRHLVVNTWSGKRIPVTLNAMTPMKDIKKVVAEAEGLPASVAEYVTLDEAEGDLPNGPDVIMGVACLDDDAELIAVLCVCALNIFGSVRLTPVISQATIYLSFVLSVSRIAVP